MLDSLLDPKELRHVQLINHFGIEQSTSSEEYIKIPIDLPWEELKKDCHLAYEKFGWFGMVHRMHNDWVRSKIYGGLGLTYNPDYIFDIDRHAHGWGQPRSIKMDLDPKVWLDSLTKYDYSKHVGDGMVRRSMNTYDDPLGLRIRTDVTHFRSLSSIFEKLKRPMFQGRMAEIRASEYGHLKTEENMELNWHTDEQNEIISRLLIPIDFSEEYFIEFRDTGTKLFFEPGYAYHWDTYKIHRWNFNYHKNIKNRTCIVLGWSPWLDLNNGVWSINEYCNKIQPMDMLRQGLVI